MIRASPPPKKKTPAPPKKSTNQLPKIPTKIPAGGSKSPPPKRSVSPPKRGVSPPKRRTSPPKKRSPILPKKRPPPPHSSSPPKRKSPKQPPPAKKPPPKRSPPKSPPPVSPPKRRKPSSAQKSPPPPSPPPPSPPTGSGGVDLGNAQKVLKMLQPYFDDPQFMMFAINGGLLTLMGKALNSSEKVTFFVPDPDTIKDLPADSPLINDPAIATAVVNFHVVRGRQVTYTELTQAATGTTYMTDQHEPLVKDAASFMFNVVLRPSQGPSRATITMPNAYTDESMQLHPTPPHPTPPHPPGARTRLTAHPRLGLLRPSNTIPYNHPSTKPSPAIPFGNPYPTIRTVKPSHSIPTATTGGSREADHGRGNTNPSSVQFRSQHHCATTTCAVTLEVLLRAAEKHPSHVATATPPPSSSDLNNTVPPPPAQ
ncbi:unnamed protein product [Closterium sp. Naga37s-1]|nr:unnamed protein product [Closterium sp. Naga37s-1]